MQTRVLIATPTTRQVVQSGYMASVVALITQMMRSGLKLRFTLNDGAAIGMQRDMIAHQFLADPALTHLFFIDSDMTFPPDLGNKLLACDKDLIAALCPRRSFDLARARENPDAGFDFLLGPMRRFERVGELYRMPDGIGAGLMLIRRGVFERISSNTPPERYRANGTWLTRYFGEIVSPEGHLLSEDWAFCRRFIEVGGEVWGYPSASIGHIGTMVYETSFDAWVKATHSPPS
jgi:hypothetical protein